MEEKINHLDKDLGLLKNTVDLKLEQVNFSLTEISTNFKIHDEKEMKKYDEIKEAIKKQDYKIAFLFLIVTGAVEFDKLSSFLSLIFPF